MLVVIMGVFVKVVLMVRRLSFLLCEGMSMKLNLERCEVRLVMGGWRMMF